MVILCCLVGLVLLGAGLLSEVELVHLVLVDLFIFRLVKESQGLLIPFQLNLGLRVFPEDLLILPRTMGVHCCSKLVMGWEVPRPADLFQWSVDLQYLMEITILVALF